MSSMTDFEREVQLLLTELDADCTRLENRIQQAQEALDAADRKRITLRDTLSIYREHYKLPVASSEVDETLRQKLSGKTVKEMIITVATGRKDPVFRVLDINRQLVQAGMFTDEAAARDSVYSTLGRNRKTFIKVASGRYMLNPDMAHASIDTEVQTMSGLGVAQQVTPPTTSKRRKSQNQGLADRIRRILEEQPSLSQEQMLAYLQSQGVKIEGGHPFSSVNIAYANLGRRGLLPDRHSTPIQQQIAM